MTKARAKLADDLLNKVRMSRAPADDKVLAALALLVELAVETKRSQGLTDEQIRDWLDAVLATTLDTRLKRP